MIKTIMNSIRRYFKTSQSKYWREFAWKVGFTFFFFTTHDKLKKWYPEAENQCWRGCGEQEANYTHCYFTCPVLTPYWEEVEKIVRYIFDLNEYSNIEIWLGVHVEGKIKYILRITAMKQVTKTWRQPNTPQLKTWLLKIEQTLNMEK